MSENRPRRALRLALETEPVEEAPWRIRGSDGQVRGPLTVTAIRSLVEVGIVNADTSIAAVEGDSWQRVSDHPLWNAIKPVPVKFSLQGSVAPEPSANLPPAALRQDITPRMREAIEAKNQEEINRLISYWRRKKAASVVRGIRELFVFSMFLTVGDLLLSFIDPSQGVAKWMASLGVLIVALGYYIFRAIVF